MTESHSGIAALIAISTRLAERAPPGGGQGLIDPVIASHVAVELRPPVVAVGAGAGPVLWAPMPEAAVDEDGDPPPREDDIWTHP